MSATPPSAQGASCIGREHLRLGRNNQDGWWLEAAEGRVIGVVADGCGSQPHSEVGAKLGSRFLGTWLAGQPLTDELPARATEALTAWLGRTAGEFGAARVDEVLEAALLFTFLAAIREGARCLVFGLGDGAVLVDERLLVLDPGPENAPNYCAYRLGDARRPEPVVHFDGAAEVVAVMTDGLDASPARLGSLLAQRESWKNPLTLQRRLNVLAERERLVDDATLIVV